VARYISFLEDFNYQLKHIPGTSNRANALLRRPDYNDGLGDNAAKTKTESIQDQRVDRLISLAPERG
jgi:hypothetical protein